VTAIRIAVLGGDGRELHISERLMAEGYDVAQFGYDVREAHRCGALARPGRLSKAPSGSSSPRPG
jgi:hypothetical protein